MPRKSSPRKIPDAPFGYTFDHSEQSDPSYPPAGPPLLDNNEASLLDSFFNDPNNIDPTILSLPTDFQADSGNFFANNSLEWTMPGMPTASGPSSSSQQLHRSAQGRQIPPSADVYAAAGILHHHNNNSNNHNSTRPDGAGPYDSYSYALASAGPEASQMNGFGIPLPNAPNSDYDLGEGHNGFYNNGYGAAEAPNPYTAGLQSRLRGPPRPRLEAPLRFGSDDNFRESAYVAPAAEMPDKNLIEAVDHNFSQDPDTPKSGKDRGSNARPANRKRGRQPTPNTVEQASDEDERGSEERPFRRRVKEEDSEEEYGQSNNGIKRRKKKTINPIPTAAKSSGSAQSSSLPSPNVKKQRLSSSNIAKERRENLTEEQKRNNHILSEQKRRNLIKNGFEDLNRMVPELRASGLSKSNMLVEAARFMRKLRDGNDDLRLHMESLDHG